MQSKASEHANRFMSGSVRCPRDATSGRRFPVPAKMNGIEGRNSEEGLKDSGVLVLASFIPEFLKSFSEIVVVCNWMTFLDAVLVTQWSFHSEYLVSDPKQARESFE